MVASAQCASSTSEGERPVLPQGREQGVDRVEQPLPGPFLAHLRGFLARQLGQDLAHRARDVRRARHQGLVEPGGVLAAHLAKQVRHGQQRHLGRQGAAGAGRHERLGSGSRRGDERGLADAGLPGDQQEAGAGVEMAAYGQELVAAAGDPRAGRSGASAAGGRSQS